MANIIYVSLGTTGDVLKTSVFQRVIAEVNTALTGREHQIQAFVLAWKGPNFFGGSAYTGGAAGSSVAAAFSQGALLANPGMPGIRTEPYHHQLFHGFYNANSIAPYTEFGIRPTLHLMTNENTVASVKALIDRGVAADGILPAGDGYYIRTKDLNRNSRWGMMQRVPGEYDGMTLQALDLRNANQDFLSNVNDILCYFTGDEVIHDIETNTYLPGAIADHLTSSGGVIHSASQMFVGEWIDAGVTASYGTVSEPTASTLKFPNVELLTREYVQGGTILGSYWKSVSDVSQGYFVGEPLARPFKPQVAYDENTLEIKTALFDTALYYLLESAPSAAGPWSSLGSPLSFDKYGLRTVQIPNASALNYFRISPDYFPPSAPSNHSVRFVPDSVLMPCKKEVPHAVISFDAAIDNTGVVDHYRVTIDGTLFMNVDGGDQMPQFRVGYTPNVIQKQPNQVQVVAVDANGNTSSPMTLSVNLPGHHPFGFEVRKKGDRYFLKKCPANYVFPSQPIGLVSENKADSVLFPCGFEVPHYQVNYDTPAQGQICQYNVYVGGQLFDSFSPTRAQPTHTVRIGYDPKALSDQAYPVAITAVDGIGNESDPALTYLPVANFHPFGYGYNGTYITECPGATKEFTDQAHPETSSEIAPKWFSYPNPFSDEVYFTLRLLAKEQVSLHLYNQFGQVVWTYNKELPAGSHTLLWDGQDAEGQPVPVGIYYGQVRIGARIFSQQILKN